MSSKYIVRQPIKDAAGTIIGYEILYHGENEAFSNDNGTSSADFAAADTIYNFLTQNSTKVLKGTLNFMTFTTMLLMKKTPGCLTNRTSSFRLTTVSSYTPCPCTSYSSTPRRAIKSR